MKILSNRIRFLLTFIIMVTGLAVFCYWQNNDLVTTKIVINNNKIPIPFNGYKIVQISDLHNKEFGRNQSKLLNLIKKANPNIIVITGDLISSKDTKFDIAMELIYGAIDIAPVYYVPGNHEAWSAIYPELTQKLIDSGVVILSDKKIQITKEDSSIDLMGLSDPSFTLFDYGEYQLGKRLNNLVESDVESFKILLSHRPDLIEIYASNKIDLAFTGHAHGGQFRLPLIGGLGAPDQGFFPKYTSGTYTMNDTTMVVSRGLGKSKIPIRIFNRPEIIIVTLKNE
ncbi:MAG: metallophosphoesterase [Mobilitalea sp.]